MATLIFIRVGYGDVSPVYFYEGKIRVEITEELERPSNNEE
jgi:hypothetical protein